MIHRQRHLAQLFRRFNNGRGETGFNVPFYMAMEEPDAYDPSVRFHVTYKDFGNLSGLSARKRITACPLFCTMIVSRLTGVDETFWK